MENQITFEELIEYGKNNGANMVNRMPWSFRYKDYPVSHERDDCYLIMDGNKTIRIHPGEVFHYGAFCEKQDLLNPITLEELLRTKVKSKDKDDQIIEITPDFRVVVQRMKDDRIHFIIHPIDYSGKTLDFVIMGNQLKPLIEERWNK